MDQLVSEALLLPSSSRAFLAEKLLESLDFEEDFEISDEWKAEIARRIRELDNGTATTVPAEQVFADLRARLG
jgi:putative addiction module component (TIGR02574 family)